MQHLPSPIAPQSRPTREIVHDLRNLFAVLASAGHLLEGDPEEPERAQLLAAIESAAQRGAQLTSVLLDASRPGPTAVVDVNARLATLAPMIRALAGRASVHIDCGTRRSPARLDADAFDAAILELVANARAALSAWNSLTVRAHDAGHRIWISIVDDGDGMSPDQLAKALRQRPAGSRGNGLARVQSFVRTAHGRMRVRSRKGRGTIVTISLPTLLGAAQGGRNRRSSPFSLMAEKHDEARQPAVA